MRKLILTLFISATIISCNQEDDECVICSRQTTHYERFTTEQDTVFQILDSNIYCFGTREAGSYDMWSYPNDSVVVVIETSCRNHKPL